MKEYDFCHLFIFYSPVFNNSLIDLFQANDMDARHLYVCQYEDNYNRILDKRNAVFDSNINNPEKLLKYLQISKYIVVHSLEYSMHQLSLLDINVSKRIIWAVWGHDLYWGLVDKNIVKHFLRKIKYSAINPEYRKFKNTVKHFRAVFCGFKQDSLYISKHFKNNSLYNALYPSGYYLEDIKNQSENCRNKKIQILLGHNAGTFLNHIKNLKRLTKYKDYIDIHIPLSYGGADNAQKIIEFAKANFDQSCVHFYMNFMDSKEYIELLSKMDIAIFDIKYQAAFGNIILLLYLGKKIYLRKSGVMYKGLKSEGLNIFDVSEIGNVGIDKLREKFNAQPNVLYGRNLLSKEYIFNQWKTAFEDILERNISNE